MVPVDSDGFRGAAAGAPYGEHKVMHIAVFGGLQESADGSGVQLPVLSMQGDAYSSV